jgi:hypothetical protein
MSIEHKPKKCKGIGKAISVKGCNELTMYRKYGLCSNCLHDFLFETDAGKMIYQTLIIPTAKAKVVREFKTKRKTETKELREKTINYKNKLQDAVQKLARLIDKDLPCLARGMFGKMAGGHVFSKGGHTQMRFNLHNIHRQSFASNSKHSDDGLLREKLEKEYGSEYLNFVKSLRLGDVPKLKDWEYQSIYFSALKRIKSIENENRTYSVNERIELRNQINLELGIYEPEYCEYKDSDFTLKKQA